jgi:uncharacterized protein YbbC (DUF1343 family)
LTRAPLSACRRAARLLAIVGTVAVTVPSLAQSPLKPGPVTTGAEALTRSGFAALAGKRVGLIANQTSRIGSEHLADLLAKAPGVRLAAILAPEHGFRGQAEAGAKVADAVDARTGVPVYSLYGKTRKPTPAMLRQVDVLVFDIQDIGTRFYTYISTLGLAMQAAATAGIPLVVLDRPNPLGGEHVSGFVLEPARATFVGKYPIPIVHGLTVGELARMIKGEAWLHGLGALELTVVPMEGWRRARRWPALQRPWVPTSPNMPSFEAALVYPGIGIVGEGLKVNEGRGTPTPFSLFGAPWIGGASLAQRLNAAGLAGVRFEPHSYTPHSIPGVALTPRFEGKLIGGVRIVVTDADRFQPMEAGVHVLAALFAEARAKGIDDPVADLGMLNALAGTRRLHRMLADGRSAAEIIAAWQEEVARFRGQRGRYLLYPE